MDNSKSVRKFVRKLRNFQNMAVNFYLEKRTDKQGNAPIRVSVAIRGARFVTSTGYKIAPTKWDAAKQQVKRGCSNTQGVTYAVINAHLLRIIEHFTGFENQCLLTGRNLDKNALQSEYTRNFGKGSTPADEVAMTFVDVWGLFVEEMGTQNQWTKATYQKFDALKNHLTAWNAAITFDSLNEAGLTDFVGFLRDALEMRNTTIGKQISFLKWFLRWATGKGYNEQKAFMTFAPKLKTAPKKVIFLEWGELMNVYNYTIPGNGTPVTLTDASGQEYTKIVHDAAALEKARDIFCFCCFTSLRFSDAANLKRSNIDGENIIITTIKTADTLKIELNKFALAILAKYEGESLPNNKALPSMTNQRMNIYLKDICELCGINQPITQTYYRGNQRHDETLPKYALIGTHTGRRTFICNALMLGITPQIVMKWTGHSDYKSMRPYIDVTDNAKAKAMDLFNNL